MLKPNEFIIQIQNEIESKYVQEILFKLECYWINKIRPDFIDKRLKYILVIGYTIQFIEDNEFEEYQDILKINFEQLGSLT